MKDPQKVFVIGAGISGLSAAIYAQRSGFDVTIFEKHNIPGGLSTSWIRKKYFFEGGMHWLTGSSQNLTLNKLWKECKALQENNPIIVKDPFYTLINNNKELNLYRDIDKLEQHFNEYAPEDIKNTKKLCNDIRTFLPVHMIVKDIPFLKTKNPKNPKILELLKMLGAILKYRKLSKESYLDYVNRFNNEDIRHLLSTVIGYRYNALSLIYTLATFASGDCGYPEGGSLRMANNMASYFMSLGGKIEYRKEVSSIKIENKRVKGLYIKDDFIPCDNIIVTEDTRKAIDTLFQNKLNEPWCKHMRKNTVTEQNMFICLGIKANLSKYPKAIVLPFSKPFKYANLSFNEIRLNNYATYSGYAPDNCTSITCLLLGDSYHFWKEAKEDGTYKEKKAELANQFITEISKYIPEIKDNVEVIDVATPLTYERYTNSYEGSWMSVLNSDIKFMRYPCKSKSTKGLYFASQRSIMPGGLPIAICAGRKASQYLCRDNKVIFI